ncbi:RNA-directed DNA polymerase from mobile element jockey [Trichonephila clavipes]|nr:RNA-directed DNA polymerase from mobile element jockey [Trichonephila clavipes]
MDGKDIVLPTLKIDKISTTARFLLLSLETNEMSKKSRFSIQKVIIGIGGEPKSVKRLRFGDLLIETNSALQTKSFLLAKSFLNSPLTISLHKTLNSCRGVISEPDLLTTPDGEILDGFSDQVPAVTKFSTSTQAQLVPSTSSVTVTSPSIFQPPNSVIDTVSTASDNLSISTASFSSTACSVLETTTTASNTIPTTSQDTTQTSKPRRKKRSPKNQSNTIKPKIEIKTAPHRPRKSASTEYTTDEEDMIIYDVCVCGR